MFKQSQMAVNTLQHLLSPLTNAVLVVDVADLLHFEAFLLVQSLLLLQNSFVEKLLQLLVTIVDAKLLKAVRLEIF